MFGTLVFFLVAGQLVKEPSIVKPGIIHALIRFVQNVLIQFRDQTKDSKLLGKVVAVTVVSTGIHSVWFYHSAVILGYDPDPIGIVLATLVLRIITLVRVVPGNLGVQEIMTGSVFLAAGLGLDEGLMTGLLIRLMSVLLAGTFGAAGLYSNFRYFGTDSLKSLFFKLNSSKQS